jgi:hypothetical protein
MSENRKNIDWIVCLVDEWPLGPPRFPVKKVVCGTCGKAVWLEVTPSYLLVEGEGVEVRFVCTDCAMVKQNDGGSFGSLLSAPHDGSAVEGF